MRAGNTKIGELVCLISLGVCVCAHKETREIVTSKPTLAKLITPEGTFLANFIDFSLILLIALNSLQLCSCV